MKFFLNSNIDVSALDAMNLKPENVSLDFVSADNGFKYSIAGKVWISNNPQEPSGATNNYVVYYGLCFVESEGKLQVYNVDSNKRTKGNSYLVKDAGLFDVTFNGNEYVFSNNGEQVCSLTFDGCNQKLGYSQAVFLLDDVNFDSLIDAGVIEESTVLDAEHGFRQPGEIEGFVTFMGNDVFR